MGIAKLAYAFEDEFDVDLEIQHCYCCGEEYPRDALIETDSQLLCDGCDISFPDEDDWESLY